MGEIPGELVHSVVCMGYKNLKVVITTGQQVYIINDSNEPQNVAAGKAVVGFYKGKWWSAGAKKRTGKQMEDGEKDESPKDILYKLDHA